MGPRPADGSHAEQSVENSDYVVYVDESGDHSLESINPDFPVFVLAFCIFEKRHYADAASPALQRFKFKHFGHDMVVLHEHELRKSAGPFNILLNAHRRAAFMEDLNQLVTNATFTIISCVIRKEQHRRQYTSPTNPYHIALKFGLERVARFLASKGEQKRKLHIVVESRGKREDDELELEFRRVCDGSNYGNAAFPFEVIFASKKANACGLQLADLVARPIGRHVLKPDQPNRAFELLQPKLYRSPAGTIAGWGLKCFP